MTAPACSDDLLKATVHANLEDVLFYSLLETSWGLEFTEFKNRTRVG